MDSVHNLWTHHLVQFYIAFSRDHRLRPVRSDPDILLLRKHEKYYQCVIMRSHKHREPISKILLRPTPTSYHCKIHLSYKFIPHRIAFVVTDAAFPSSHIHSAVPPRHTSVERERSEPATIMPGRHMLPYIPLNAIIYSTPCFVVHFQSYASRQSARSVGALVSLPFIVL